MHGGKHRRILLAVVALTIALRLLHLADASSDLFFRAPIIDARTNVEDARQLVEDNWLGPPVPYWKPPLYPYLLAVEYGVAGYGPWLPRVTNVVFDALTCVLVFLIGARLFSRRVGLVAAAIVAVYGPLIYFSGEIVSASLSVLLYTATLHLALRAYDQPSAPRWLAAGAVLGATALTRPEALLLAPLVAIAAVRTTPRRWLHAGAVAGGIAALVVPVAARNLTRGDDATLISANGGINFYVGTNPDYRGMVGLRPGGEWEQLMVAPAEAGIYDHGRRASSFHVRRALRVIADDPLGAAAHTLKKAVLFAHAHELASNEDLYQARGKSFVLAATLWHLPGMYFPFGLLLPFALLGLTVAGWRRGGPRLLVGYLGILVAVAMLFFVTSRYRAPAVPVLALFAVVGGEWLVAVVRERRWRPAAPRLVAAGVILVLGNAGWLFAADRAAYADEMAAELHHYRGTALFSEYRRYDDAAAELRRAIELAPNRASTHFNLAQTYEAMQRADDMLAALAQTWRVTDVSPGERYFIGPAIRGIDRALRLPNPPATPLARAMACLLGNDHDCAVASFRAQNDATFLGHALYRRGIAHLGAGANAAAVTDLVEAAALRPGDSDTRMALAIARHRTGDASGAADAIHAFRDLEWPRGSFLRGIRERGPTGPLESEALDVMRTYRR